MGWRQRCGDFGATYSSLPFQQDERSLRFIYKSQKKTFFFSIPPFFKKQVKKDVCWELTSLSAQRAHTLKFLRNFWQSPLMMSCCECLFSGRLEVCFSVRGTSNVVFLCHKVLEINIQKEELRGGVFISDWADDVKNELFLLWYFVKVAYYHNSKPAWLCTFVICFDRT